jgi:integrase
VKAPQTTSPRRRQYPLKVVSGSSHVTVYKTAHKTNRSGWTYTVAYASQQGRKRQKFAQANAAIEEARIIAAKLSAGQVEATELTRGQRDEYLEARRMVDGYPLISALKEWQRARELCGANLLIAAQEWHAANGKGQKYITVAELVKEFLRDKERSGVDTRAGYARTLPRLVETFAQTPVHTLSSQALKEWLHTAFTQPGQKHVNASTFNSHRRRMVTLWRWARDEGYLPRRAQTEIEQVKPLREESAEIGILTVDAFAAILKLAEAAQPDLLATAVLAGFAGLRRTEVLAQRWDQIDLKRGLLTVTKAKRNTPSMRIVHLCPTAVEWLLICGRRSELVSPAWGLDHLRKLALGAGIPCPDNAFRHSFITYRVANTGNVDETALEAGNSRDIVFKHYRELVSREDGAAWFALTPEKVRSLGKLEYFPKGELKQAVAKRQIG